MPEVEVIGVYPVEEADEPCHLIELRLPRDVQIGHITQQEPGQPPDNWQVPWDETTLEEEDDGTRIAFFFHYLDPSRPLLVSPDHEVSLPEPTSKPERLSHIEYEPP